MSFDLEKFEAVAELGEVIRLQNEAMDRLREFRKARPYLIMPNLAKMVEENMKENVQVLYKEMNNLHRPAEQQTRYICEDCHMAYLVKLPGGICDECRAKRATKPRDYVLNAKPLDLNDPDEDETHTPAPDDAQPTPDAPAQTDETSLMDEADVRAEETDISVTASTDEVPMDEVSREGIAADVEHAATGDKLPVEKETAITEEPPVDASGPDSEAVTLANAAAQGDSDAEQEMSEEFKRFMDLAGTDNYSTGPTPPQDAARPDPASSPGETDVFSETDLHVTEDRNTNDKNKDQE